MLFRKTPRIQGVVIPGPRFTRWAVLYFVLFICLPVLGLALLLDVVMFFVVRELFSGCYAILCFF